MPESRNWTSLLLPVAVIACVLVILTPLPGVAMDVLLAANITIAVIILLTAIQVKTPLEFGVFPTLLLATTLSRLVLNIATTRLILTDGTTAGASAAGGVIQGFGEFVAGNQIVVGGVIFGIILIVQFVVITKGATRISEVAARFTLDGMPGRQMAIDAELTAGTINAEDARRRRDELQMQADFYGTMDGATKYVRGDAIAGLLITAINIVGGLVIGVSAGMGFAESANIFIRLTIGDGLVSQLPGLLISLAAGILISRSTRSSNLSDDFVGQLFLRPEVLFVAGGFLVLLAFTGLPVIPLTLVAGTCLATAWYQTQGSESETDPNQRNSNSPTKATAVSGSQSHEPDFGKFLAVHPVEIELGVNLVPLAGNGMMEQITLVRQVIANEIGIVLPKVKVRDNLELPPDHFQIRINRLPVREMKIYSDRVMLVRRTEAAPIPNGVESQWHAGQGAWWVPVETANPRVREYQFLEPRDVVVHALRHEVRLHADQILTRQSTAFLIDQLRQESPATVDELIPDVMKIGRVQQVLQRLLSDGVSIKPLSTILEALADLGQATDDVDLLVEGVRKRLSPWITASLQNEEGAVEVIELDQELHSWLGGHMQVRGDHRELCIDGRAAERLVESIQACRSTNPRVALLVHERLRPSLQHLFTQRGLRIVVTTSEEISRNSKIETIAIFGLADVQYFAA